ncbi:Transmembrane exosortase [Phycisphaerae bacterium RAS1]|nr:Transmembrane exosortase [Phycisphaerae bacterium RAS1]
MAAAATTPWRITFDRAAQIKAALVGVAFVGTFWTQLNFLPDPHYGALVYAWLHEADWSHGPIIPVFSAYLAYLSWDKIRRCRIEHTWVGLVLMLVSLTVYLYSLFPAGLRFTALQQLAMMVCLLGVIIYLCGLPVMRYAWLPWLYLFFAIPLPKEIYVRLTDPLRRMAAVVATWVLSLDSELQIARIGSMLEFTYRGKPGTIGVADACSGMRSTITLCALGAAVTFMTERPWWQRAVMLLSCVPIATFCNFIRVSTTCWLHIYVDPKYATGTYHMTLGLVVLAIATVIFMGLGWVLDNLFIEASESERAA